MSRINYYLTKEERSGELLYLEYEKIKGYHITPKTSVEDAIKVNKIVFVNPGLSEKIIKKKIDIKVRQLLNKIREIDEDGDSDDGVEKALMDAEKLRMMIINNYVKYLGNTYQSLTIQKINIIINSLKSKLINKRMQRMMPQFNNLFYLDEDMEESRGRRGR